MAWIRSEEEVDEMIMEMLKKGQWSTNGAIKKSINE